MVHVECLEVEEIEGSGRQSIKWVNVLLNGSILSLGLGSSLSSLGLRGLRLENRLQALLGHADLTEDGDELGESGDAREPGAGLRGSLGETLIEHKLEGKREAGSKEDISDRDAVADKPVTGESLVERAEVLLDSLAGIVEGSLSDLVASSKNGIDGGSCSLHDTRLPPVGPLIDLSALDGVGSEKGSVAMGEELGNSLSLLEGTLRSLKERELVGGVDLLVALFGASLFRDDIDSNILAGDLGNDLAGLHEDVADHLGVDFHGFCFDF
jgi:hypothetical protein